VSHPIEVFDSDSMIRECLAGIGVSLRRLEAAGQMPRAVALREDLWPTLEHLTGVYGYPVVRLAASSPVMWGVLC